MTDYRTKFFDNQLNFGSGSKINADDIPETSTRIWLTNSLQGISGSKIFADDLNLNTNKITNVTDPTSDQDAATKNYVDDTSGSCAQSLQSVTNVGNTTTKDITAANLKSNADFYTNYDGAEGNSYLYFYEGGSPKGKYLKWDDADDRFEINGILIVGGALQGDVVASTIDFYTNYGGPDADSYLYFYEGGSNIGASFMWDDSEAGFELSHNLSMNVNQIHNLASPSGSWDAANKSYVDTYFVKGTVYKSSALGNIPSGSSINVTHNLNSDHLLIELMYKPASGSHANKWINADGVLYYEIQNTNSLDIYNEGDQQVDNEDALISIIGL